MWPLLILDQGQFDTLNKKFMELASGGWKGRNLSTRVGSQSQKTRMRVPILGARCPGRLWILWQIDVGIYDELASVRQLVKGRIMQCSQESLNHMDLLTPYSVANNPYRQGLSRRFLIAVNIKIDLLASSIQPLTGSLTCKSSMDLSYVDSVKRRHYHNQTEL